MSQKKCNKKFIIKFKFLLSNLNREELENVLKQLSVGGDFVMIWFLLNFTWIWLKKNSIKLLLRTIAKKIPFLKT